MIFSKLARSARSKGLVVYGGGGGGVRSAILSEWRARAPSNEVEGGLGFLRRRFASLAAHKGVVDANDLSRVFANPRLRRFFSTQAPKKNKKTKNYENYYPKDAKKAPKNEHKSESREGSKKSENENAGDFNTKEFQNLLVPLMAIALILSSFSLGSREQQQISFQEFKNKLLEAGLVDHIDVSNKSVAKVYVRSSPKSQTEEVVQGPGAKGRGGQYKYYFNIGSVESFEEKLEEAQEALGVDSHDFVPVTYVSEMIWYQELLRFAPTLLLLGTLVYGARRMQGGLGSVGGPGGKGGRGIFNIGKAQITRADKNSKNKIYFKDVAGCEEAKQEIMEFVHFLQNPKKYEDLGAKIPKGALLVGPPGTGKTLLAKATAGESAVPFLSISGSDFMEMFVFQVRGPIFEDGPNFDTAFRLFHGQDGLVPLSGAEKPKLSSPAFNPLAAKAATISLSSFGHGGPFGFDAFSDMFKNQKRKSDSSKKKDSSSKGGNDESMSDDWLQTGNCPIAKSYRAVSGVAPLVAKILQPPPGMQYKCPKAIVAARAAISKTAFAKNLRPQPLSSKVLVIGMLGMALNVPLGVWREHTEKFSASWFIALHAAVPFIGILRKSVLMPKMAMVFTIAASVMGQVIGSRAERYRLKSVAQKKLTLTGPDKVDGRCGVMKWNPMLLEVASPVTT